MKSPWIILFLLGFTLVAAPSRSADEEGAEAEEATATEKQVTVKITDTSANQMIAMGFALGAQFSNESTEGYEKGYTLDGMPIHESYQSEPKSGTLATMAGGRFHVEIQVSGLEPEEMKAWLERVDVKKLAETKPEEGKAIVHFKKLLTFLPEPPNGWTAEKPTGSTSEAMGFKSSEVQRVYTGK